MQPKISNRMQTLDFQGEFTAALLRAATVPDLISFGGGFPNPIAFPVDDLEAAMQKVLKENGVRALQYSNSEGYAPLRQMIAERYKKVGQTVSPDRIIITNGSQQALDMASAVLLNPGDEVVVEKPTYFAALQTFHVYESNILSVTLREDGLDCDELERVLSEHSPKLIYIIPNFQNPTGFTYSPASRERFAAVMKKYPDIVVIEDNPYSELRFRGMGGPSIQTWLGEQCCMLGSFSKIISPGMRIGWIVCENEELYKRLSNYKTAMDLHTNILGQMAITQFLTDNDLDEHIGKVKVLYQQKADFMMECMSKYLPEEVSYTKPEGGMFIWATLPEGLKAMDVQAAALEKGVLICAGDPFYEHDRGVRTMRINYSNSSDEAIEKGMMIVGETIRELSGSSKK